MRSIYILIVGLMMSFNVLAEDNSYFIEHLLEKVVGIGFMINEFQRSECGKLLENDSLPIIARVREEIEYVEIETKKKYQSTWEKVSDPDGRLSQEVRKWVLTRVEGGKRVSLNRDFACGVVFGEMMTELSKIEIRKLELINALNK
ncbi:MAG TPA: hypothetical protein VF268_13430 [Gammaproteobacteria bacterium]